MQLLHVTMKHPLLLIQYLRVPFLDISQILEAVEAASESESVSESVRKKQQKDAKAVEPCRTWQITPRIWYDIVMYCIYLYVYIY